MQRRLHSHHSVVGLEWAGPGVGGGIVFPFSVSVGLAFEFLFSDVFIGVAGSLFHGSNGGNESED